jgi:hypothetical protein
MGVSAADGTPSAFQGFNCVDGRSPQVRPPAVIIRFLCAAALVIATGCAGPSRVPFARGDVAISAAEWVQIEPDVQAAARFVSGDEAQRVDAKDVYAALLRHSGGRDELWVSLAGARCSLYCYTTVFRRVGNEWQLADYRNLGAAADGRPFMVVHASAPPFVRTYCSTDFCVREVPGHQGFSHCTPEMRCSGVVALADADLPLVKSVDFEASFRLSSQQRPLSIADRRGIAAVIAVEAPRAQPPDAFAYFWTDVTGDGVDEVVAMLYWSSFCGTTECSGYVLQQTAGRWIAIDGAGDGAAVIVDARDRNGAAVQYPLRPTELYRPSEDLELLWRWLEANRLPQIEPLPQSVGRSLWALAGCGRGWGPGADRCHRRDARSRGRWRSFHL